MDKYYVEKFRIREDGTVERKTIGRLKHGAWARSEYIEEFLSVYEFESREVSESRIRGPLYFDLDTNLSTRKQYKELKHQVRRLYHCFAKWKIEKNEIELYFSGAKGFHLLVPAEVLGIDYGEDWNLINKAIAESLKENYGVTLLDTSIYDKRRLLRMPGSINFKSRLYKISLCFDEFDKISLKQLREQAKAKPTKPKDVMYVLNIEASQAFNDFIKDFRIEQKNEEKKESAPLTFSSDSPLLPCIEKALKTNCPEGYRNKTAFLLASSLLQRKCSIQDIEEKLGTWNRNNDVPLSSAELQVIINNAVSNDNKDKNHYGCKVFQDEGLCIANCSLNRDNKAA